MHNLFPSGWVGIFVIIPGFSPVFQFTKIKRLNYEAYVWGLTNMSVNISIVGYLDR